MSCRHVRATTIAKRPRLRPPTSARDLRFRPLHADRRALGIGNAEQDFMSCALCHRIVKQLSGVDLDDINSRIPISNQIR